MIDNWYKLLMYFKAKPDYWKLAAPYKGDQMVGNYPLSFRDRLYKGHYVNFDEAGIPMFHSKTGELVHFITGMCSFAFANWEEFLLTTRADFADKVVLIAKYLIEMAVPCSHGGLMLFDYDNDSKTNPIACAMNHGEAISVLCRAYSYTGDIEYIDVAKQLSIPFNYPYGSEGVASPLSVNGTTWYLEGGKEILNGHIYSLIGLKELAAITKEEKIERLFLVGAQSTVESISFFDNGYWSLYWQNKPLYIASAMYHNLHICQLQILSKMMGSDTLLKYSTKFEDYARSPFSRIKAGLALVMGKLNNKL